MARHPSTGATFAIGVGFTGTIEVTWASNDPTIARVLTRVAALPPGSVGRHEAEAQLHAAMARQCWKDAGIAEERERDSASRRGPFPRGTCGACMRALSLGADGTLRPHGPVEDRCPGSGAEPLELSR